MKRITLVVIRSTAASAVTSSKTGGINLLDELHRATAKVNEIANKLQAEDDTLSRVDAVKEAFKILKEVVEEKKKNAV